MRRVSSSTDSGVHAADGGTRDIVNPADGSVVAVVDEAEPRRRGAPPSRRRGPPSTTGAWPATLRSPSARRCWIGSPTCWCATGTRLPTSETLDTGKTLKESYIDIDDVTSVFRYYARLAAVESDRLVDVGDPTVISRVVREPIGVCVLIAPWNYPLLQMSWKIAPALAAGCTMVAKPSEVTPLTHDRVRPAGRGGGGSGRRGEPGPGQRCGGRSGADRHPRRRLHLLHRRLRPPGGPSHGRPLHHVTKVAVELGGKNPHIVFADAEWESAVDARAHRRVPALRSGVLGGHPADRRGVDRRRRSSPSWWSGPRRSASATGMDPGQRDRAAGVDGSTAPRSKAHVAAGDVRRAPSWSPVVAGPPSRRSPTGSFYLPTIFDHCDRSMRIVQEETFGPILTVERFTTEAEAIELGQRHGIRSRRQACGRPTPARAERVVRALRHGTVWVNDFGILHRGRGVGRFRQVR